MTKVLIIDSAATGEKSVSRKLTNEFAEQLRSREPRAEIIRRDVGRAPIPHLTEETVGAIRGAPGDTEAAAAALALSDALIAELKGADLIVIGAPMYNFGMPSTLKAWFDHVLRAGITFRYTSGGPEGLVRGKRAIVIEARAGLYSEGPAAGMDHQEPHIRTLLGFMGVTDVTYVRAEKLAFGPEAATAAITEAIEQLDGIAQTELALAA
ncbi:MAG TPA: FMN-dependent NADH-azoreductase [Allosphingosinicella sp.]|jgi:FMN-dependent NADH-azoreductase|uniref:FMN-dependent NADH-azoreductase n=1 Tax=Allosphingosinicella sp. TaxID=2823234 RepID=UPI002F2AD877